MTFRTAFPFTLALLGLAACGGDDSASSGDTADAGDTPVGPGECQWVSNAEASEVLGFPVTLTGAEGNPTVCTLQSEPRTYDGQVVVMDGMTLDGVQAGYGTQVPIDGLGDRASWIDRSPNPGDNTFGQVGVEQDGQGIIITLMPVPAQALPDLREKTEALARAVVARL